MNYCVFCGRPARRRESACEECVDDEGDRQGDGAETLADMMDDAVDKECEHEAEKSDW